MNGTEKQIKWAEKIKANIFERLNHIPPKIGKGMFAIGGKSAVQNFAEDRGQDEADKVVVWLESQNDAAWWIDNRNYEMNVDEMLNSISAKLK